MTTATPAAKARISPTTQIRIGLVIGLIAGYIISIQDKETATYYADIIRPFSTISSG